MPRVNARNWSHVGEKLGSNPGGRFVDKTGRQWYLKQSKSNDHANNEIVAARLYQLAGANVLDYHLAELPNGKLGTATPWQEKEVFDPNDPDHIASVQEDFAVHAWLANWDAVGLTADNQAIVNGKMTTLDTGGALLFRAQGAPKGDAFGKSVSEWESLRDTYRTGYAQRVFSSMTPAQLIASVDKVAAVSPDTIRSVVMAAGPGNHEQCASLADTLVARRADLLKKASALRLGQAS